MILKQDKPEIDNCERRKKLVLREKKLRKIQYLKKNGFKNVFNGNPCQKILFHNLMFLLF